MSTNCGINKKTLGLRRTIAALVFSVAPDDSTARLDMSTMSDGERSMPERLAGNDYKKLRKECPKTNLNRPHGLRGRRDVDNGDADDGWSVARLVTAAESNLDTRLVPASMLSICRR
jgi:hypothetical protein